MLTIDPKTLPTARLQAYLQTAIGPRPIAFASTVDAEGNPNLSPFSFFNVFSANPPILVFSPARRVRDNTLKHTLLNCEATREVVINVVTYDIVQQMSLSSTEYAEGVNEFHKSGLTMLASETVAPFRVAESPVQFECRVNDIIKLGTEGGAGNLIICEIQKIHIHETVLNEEGLIEQTKIDLVSRMGGNWYSRANAGLFEIPKPLVTLGIGVDAIPESIRLSKVLTGNDLGQLGNVEALPNEDEIRTFIDSQTEWHSQLTEREVHEWAQRLLEKQDAQQAWKLLLAHLQTTIKP